MRAVLIVLGIAVLAIAISVFTQPRKDLTSRPQDREDAKRSQPSPPPPATATGLPAADAFNPPRIGVITTVLTVKDRGKLTIELYPAAAPNTVERVANLIKSKFYDGIKFHRVEPGFVVQAGDPETKIHGIDDPGIGSHGSGKNIPFEKNDLGHVTGSVAMALTEPQTATADSQFFINQANNRSLDKKYCVIGLVTKGLELLPKIQAGDVIEHFTIE